MVEYSQLHGPELLQGSSPPVGNGPGHFTRGQLMALLLTLLTCFATTLDALPHGGPRHHGQCACAGVWPRRRGIPLGSRRPWAGIELDLAGSNAVMGDGRASNTTGVGISLLWLPSMGANGLDGLFQLFVSPRHCAHDFGKGRRRGDCEAPDGPPPSSLGRHPLCGLCAAVCCDFRQS